MTNNSFINMIISFGVICSPVEGHKDHATGKRQLIPLFVRV
jgi:hypothetical protein